MARGELMKKLLASYGRDEDFRAIAEQIILEEEQKNNRVLARSLRQTLDSAQSVPYAPKALAPLIPFPDAASDFVERIEPTHTHKDIILSSANVRVFVGLMKEFRRADEIRRKGLPRSFQAAVLRSPRLRQNPVRGNIRWRTRSAALRRQARPVDLVLPRRDGGERP